MLTNFVFHPVFNHFPIALYFLELVLLVFWAAKNDPAYLRFARFSLRLGYLMMIPTVIAGWIDAGGFVPKVRLHASFAAGVFIFYTARLIYWQVANPGKAHYRAVQIAGAVLGCVLVAITGFAGGVIVFGGH